MYVTFSCHKIREQKFKISICLPQESADTILSTAAPKFVGVSYGPTVYVPVKV